MFRYFTHQRASPDEARVYAETQRAAAVAKRSGCPPASSENINEHLACYVPANAEFKLAYNRVVYVGNPELFPEYAHTMPSISRRDSARVAGLVYAPKLLRSRESCTQEQKTVVIEQQRQIIAPLLQ